MSTDLLQQAVEAAKSGDRANAIRLTKEYIRETPKDARGWWALTKFTDDPEVQRECLKRVLKLKPDHVQAQQMLSELDAVAAPFDYAFDDAPSPPTSGSASWMDDDPSPSFSFDDEADESFQPEINYFSDVDESPSASMFSDVRNERAPILTAQPQAKSSGGGEWLIGIGIFLLAIVALGGLAFYAYQYQYRGLFGLFGPDLTKTAQTNDFTIRYGSDWNGRVEGGIFVAASSNLPAITSDDMNFGGLANSSTSFGAPIQGEDFCYEDMQEDSVMVFVAPFDDELSTSFQQQTGFSSFQQFIDSQVVIGDVDSSDLGGDFEGVDIGVEGDQSAITVDGESSTFALMRMNFEIDDNSPFYSLMVASITESMCGNVDGDFKMNLGLYMAAINHNNREYMFMLIAFGDKAKSHERTAKRMLGSMEFLN